MLHPNFSVPWPHERVEKSRGNRVPDTLDSMRIENTPPDIDNGVPLRNDGLSQCRFHWSKSQPMTVHSRACCDFSSVMRATDSKAHRLF
jgi:hypothetical protein